ncbi:hypothetical protein [Sphingomonas sp.]|uniref:hypothetical protein n=1 Tax=Sphingomonas sp. TaxID=28214 RepID=UPI003B007EBB
MSDIRSSSPPPSPGMRVGIVSVFVLIAFLVGLAVAVVLVRRQIRQDGGVAATTVAPPAAAAVTPPPQAPAATPVLLATDPVTLATREAVLAGQIAVLEARTASLAASAEGASGQSTRAEALLAVIAARRAIDRGLGLGALDGQLQSRFAATLPNAVRIVHGASRQPVTLEDLRQGLDAIGPAAASGVSGGWWGTLRREVAGLVVLRRAGTPSPRPADHLARARRLLDMDQVDAARAEVAQLPGADDAANWLDAARRYIVARQALDLLENAALAGPPPVPVPPMPAR